MARIKQVKVRRPKPRVYKIKGFKVHKPRRVGRLSYKKF